MRTLTKRKRGRGPRAWRAVHQTWREAFEDFLVLPFVKESGNSPAVFKGWKEKNKLRECREEVCKGETNPPRKGTINIFNF